MLRSMASEQLSLLLSLSDTDLEWILEDGEVTGAHNPISETVGQMDARFQNLSCQGNVVCVYDVLVTAHSRVCGSCLIR